MLARTGWDLFVSESFSWWLESPNHPFNFQRCWKRQLHILDAPENLFASQGNLNFWEQSEEGLTPHIWWLFHKQAVDPHQHWKGSYWQPGALSCSWAAELPLLAETGSKQLLSSASGQGSRCEGCLLLPVSHKTLSLSLKGGGGKAKGSGICCGIILVQRDGEWRCCQEWDSL